MSQALVLALLPALLGFLVGRWWLLLIGALIVTTSLGRVAGHGPAGPVAVLLLAPFVGCALGVWARQMLAPPSAPGARSAPRDR